MLSAPTTRPATIVDTLADVFAPGVARHRHVRVDQVVQAGTGSPMFTTLTRKELPGFRGGSCCAVSVAFAPRGGANMDREELKAAIDELMRQYADEEIDGATYAEKMMELTSSAQEELDE